MTFIYQISIHLYYLLVLAVSPFHPKARIWTRGRFGWRNKLRKWKADGPVIWFHAASLGEFEQGRPLMEKIRKDHSHIRIILTFYSPSGYETRKNYTGADLILYLPLDTFYNARLFVKLVKPSAAIFIKYEFWACHLRALHRSGCAVYLISGIFREGQPFFKWYGSWFRKNLLYFEYFFLQDRTSAELLQQIGLTALSVTGDTRFDRVHDVALAARDIEIAARFSAGHTCIVAGSTWPEDEQYLVRYINGSHSGIRFILAPHEITDNHLDMLISGLEKPFIRFSQARPESLDHQLSVLVIDNIGMLSSLYRYGQIAYIGGGFGKGIHNILEAATFGIPVIFGPHYEKFREARDLIRLGGAFSIDQYGALEHRLNELAARNEKYIHAAFVASDYVKTNTGATSRIMEYLRKKLPL